MSLTCSTLYCRYSVFTVRLEPDFQILVWEVLVTHTGYVPGQANFNAWS